MCIYEKRIRLKLFKPVGPGCLAVCSESSRRLNLCTPFQPIRTQRTETPITIRCIYPVKGGGMVAKC